MRLRAPTAEGWPSPWERWCLSTGLSAVAACGACFFQPPVATDPLAYHESALALGASVSKDRVWRSNRSKARTQKKLAKTEAKTGAS